jgi:hypothetical protein
MRGARQLAAIVGCSFAVVAALTVPVVAQADRGVGSRMVVERTSFGAARAYVAAELVTSERLSLPPNLLAAQLYRPLLESMLRGSRTFRRQCLRIANTPHLTVTLEPRSHPWPSSFRARTVISKRGTAVSATIQLASLHDQVELIAHEIEHVIEQLDGVDLRSKAALARSGVRAGVGDGSAFETTRAVQVGLRVTEEVRQAER